MPKYIELQYTYSKKIKKTVEPPNTYELIAKELNKQFTDAVCLDMWNRFIKSEQLKKK